MSKSSKYDGEVEKFLAKVKARNPDPYVMNVLENLKREDPLKERLRKHGATDRQIAAFLGLPHASHVNQWLNCATPMPMAVRVKLEALAEMLEGEDEGRAKG